jgi:hypothetical protein
MGAGFVTVRDKRLSLWQSAVREATARSPDISPALGAIMGEAADRHATAAVKGQPITRPASLTAAPMAVETHTYLSALHFQRAEALRQGAKAATDALGSGSWSYSDNDPNWVQCVIQYNLYYVTGGNQAVYYDWTVQGGGNINYGVIDYQLPNDAKVLLIGDWATGQNDAVTLLTTAIATLKPTAILHLGDVYYSGTTTECQTKVVNVFSAVFSNPNTPQVPVFMIPGNHEYYAGGQGFYNSISVLNTGLNDCQQQASYFVLRTQDQTWQFLAMDTGIGDHDANTDALGTIGLNPTATGPALRPTEAQWHIDKLTNFSGNTILLSHHQLFSANAKINGWLTPDPAYLNTSLFGTFFPYFGTVSAWFWGHEHNFAACQNGLFGLNMGRLLGNSAYEEMQSNNPYTVNYPAVPYASNMVQVGFSPYSDSTKYYNHSLALLDFSRAAQGDPINITYYQFPSWGTSTTPEPAPTLQTMYSETIGKSDVTPATVWVGNNQINTSNGAPESNYGPSLAYYNGLLYMVYKGAHSNTLYMCWYDGTSWQGNQPIAGMSGQSNYTPAMAVYNGLLYLIYKGAHSNTLYAAWYNGKSWAGNIPISQMGGGLSPASNLAPALAVYNNTLYMSYKGAYSSTLYIAWFDGTNWHGNTPIQTNNGGPATIWTPALAVYTPDGANQLLYAVYAGLSGTLYASYFNGTSWFGNQTISTPNGTPASNSGPWMAHIGSSLVALYKGQVSNDLYSATLTGSTWTGNQTLGSTSPIAPESNYQGSIVPYGNGLYTVYKGAHSNTLYEAQLMATGKPAG